MLLCLRETQNTIHNSTARVIKTTTEKIVCNKHCSQAGAFLLAFSFFLFFWGERRGLVASTTRSLSSSDALLQCRHISDICCHPSVPEAHTNTAVTRQCQQGKSINNINKCVSFVLHARVCRLDVIADLL